MINIMYLVLMALLALNVSAEVMDAFQTLDEGNKESIATVDEQIDDSVSALNEVLKDESQREKRVLTPAIETVRAEVAQFNTYVNELRDLLIDAAGNNDGVVDEEDYKEENGKISPTGKKNKDVTTRILVLGDDGEGGEPGAGAELKQRVLETRERLIETYTNLLQEYGDRFDLNEQEIENRIQSVAVNMPFNIDDETWQNSENRNSWEDFKFGHMPLAAVLPLMSQMQSDLKVSEANLVNDMVQLAGGKQIVFDRFFPVFEADKSYVIGGERLNAQVSVGSYSSALQPENVDLRVNGQRLPLGPDGKADFSLVASGSPGPKTLQTSVRVTNPLTGDVTEEEGTFTYEIGTRSVAVSADKMNVFYIGVDNPVTVSAAGVPSGDVRVSVSGAARKKSGGNKNLVVTGNSVGEANINVSANGRNLGSFPFRVKRIPDPVAEVGGSPGGDMVNSTFRAQRGMIADLKNFDFDARCTISGFRILYVPKREDALAATNAGGTYTGQARALINRAKPGDNYLFKNIKAKCPGDNAPRDLGTMSFTIR